MVQCLHARAVIVWQGAHIHDLLFGMAHSHSILGYQFRYHETVDVTYWIINTHTLSSRSLLPRRSDCMLLPCGPSLVWSLVIILLFHFDIIIGHIHICDGTSGPGQRVMISRCICTG